LCAFFWVIPRLLNSVCRRFGTLFLFHLNRQVVEERIYLSMKMKQTECSETSAHKIQTPGNYPEGNVQQNRIMLEYSRTPNISINWDGEPFEHAENLDNFFSLKIRVCYIGSLEFSCYYLQYVPASKPFDHV